MTPEDYRNHRQFSLPDVVYPPSLEPFIRETSSGVSFPLPTYRNGVLSTLIKFSFVTIASEFLPNRLFGTSHCRTCAHARTCSHVITRRNGQWNIQLRCEAIVRERLLALLIWDCGNYTVHLFHSCLPCAHFAG